MFLSYNTLSVSFDNAHKSSRNKCRLTSSTDVIGSCVGAACGAT